MPNAASDRSVRSKLTNERFWMYTNTFFTYGLAQSGCLSVLLGGSRCPSVCEALSTSSRQQSSSCPYCVALASQTPVAQDRDTQTRTRRVADRSVIGGR